MTPRLPPHLCHQLKVLFDAGYSNLAASRRMNLARSTVQRMRSNYELFGQPYGSSGHRLGRSRTLLPFKEEVSHRDAVAVVEVH